MKHSGWMATTLLTVLLMGGLTTRTNATLIAMAEVRGLERLSQSSARMAAYGGVPFPAEAVPMAIASSLGLPNLDGIDPTGTIRVGIYTAGHFMAPPDMYMELPVSPGSDVFLTTLKEVWAEGAPMGEDTDMIRLTRPTDRPVSLPIAELYVQETATGIRLASQKERLGDAPPALDAVQGTVALGVFPSRLVPLVKPMLDMQIQSMQQMAEQMSEEEEEQLNIDQMKAGRQLLLDLLSALRGVGVAVDLDGDILQLDAFMSGTPGTVIEELVRAVQPPDERFLRAVPEDALYASVGHMAIPDSAFDMYQDFISIFMDDVEGQEHLQALIESSLTLMRNQYAGNYIIVADAADNAQAGFPSIVQGWQVNDIERLRTAMETYLDEVSMLLSEGDNEPITRAPPRTYRDIEILRYTMDSSIGDEEVAEALKEFAPMMLNMDTEYAYLDDIALSGMVSPQGMDQLIDGLLDGGPSLADHAAVRALFPYLPNDFVDLTLIRPVPLLTLLRDMLPFLPLQWTTALAADQATVVSYSHVTGRTLHTVVRMNMAEWVDIIQAGQSGMMNEDTPDDE